MGANDWWLEAMGTFKSQDHVYLSKYQGMRLGIDLSIFLYGKHRTDADKYASTSNPVYKCGNLLQSIIGLHQMLSKWIVPVYVLDGLAPPVKKEEKQKQHGKKLRQGKAYLDLLQRAKANPGISFTKEELDKASKARRDMACPGAIDHANVKAWLETNGIEHYGSLFEMDQQLPRLEKDGFIEGIIIEDSNLIASKAKLVLSKLKYNN